MFGLMFGICRALLPGRPGPPFSLPCGSYRSSSSRLTVAPSSLPCVSYKGFSSPGRPGPPAILPCVSYRRVPPPRASRAALLLPLCFIQGFLLPGCPGPPATLACVSYRREKGGPGRPGRRNRCMKHRGGRRAARDARRGGPCRCQTSIQTSKTRKIADAKHQSKHQKNAGLQMPKHRSNPK